MSDYGKPVTFRPTKENERALNSIALANPQFASSPVDLIRIALQHYELCQSNCFKTCGINVCETDSVGITLLNK